MNWANAPRRALRSCIAAAAAFERKVVGETPDLFGLRDTVRRFDCLAVTRDTSGQIEAMSLWAGESVGAVKRVQLAADIMSELVEATVLVHPRVGLVAASEQST